MDFVRDLKNRQKDRSRLNTSKKTDFKKQIKIAITL